MYPKSRLVGVAERASALSHGKTLQRLNSTPATHTAALAVAATTSAPTCAPQVDEFDAAGRRSKDDTPAGKAAPVQVVPPPLSSSSARVGGVAAELSPTCVAEECACAVPRAAGTGTAAAAAPQAVRATHRGVDAAVQSGNGDDDTQTTTTAAMSAEALCGAASEAGMTAMCATMHVGSSSGSASSSGGESSMLHSVGSAGKADDSVACPDSSNNNNNMQQDDNDTSARAKTSVAGASSTTTTTTTTTMTGAPVAAAPVAAATAVTESLAPTATAAAALPQGTFGDLPTYMDAVSSTTTITTSTTPIATPVSYNYAARNSVVAGSGGSGYCGCRCGCGCGCGVSMRRRELIYSSDAMYAANNLTPPLYSHAVLALPGAAAAAAAAMTTTTSASYAQPLDTPLHSYASSAVQTSVSAGVDEQRQHPLPPPPPPMPALPSASLPSLFGVQATYAHASSPLPPPPPPPLPPPPLPLTPPVQTNMSTAADSSSTHMRRMVAAHDAVRGALSNGSHNMTMSLPPPVSTLPPPLLPPPPPPPPLQQLPPPAFALPPSAAMMSMTVATTSCDDVYTTAPPPPPPPPLAHAAMYSTTTHHHQQQQQQQPPQQHQQRQSPPPSYYSSCGMQPAADASGMLASAPPQPQPQPLPPPTTTAAAARTHSSASAAAAATSTAPAHATESSLSAQAQCIDEATGDDADADDARHNVHAAHHRDRVMLQSLRDELAYYKDKATRAAAVREQLLRSYHADMAHLLALVHHLSRQLAHTTDGAAAACSTSHDADSTTELAWEQRQARVLAAAEAAVAHGLHGMKDNDSSGSNSNGDGSGSCSGRSSKDEGVVDVSLLPHSRLRRLLRLGYDTHGYSTHLVAVAADDTRASSPTRPRAITAALREELCSAAQCARDELHAYLALLGYDPAAAALLTCMPASQVTGLTAEQQQQQQHEWQQRTSALPLPPPLHTTLSPARVTAAAAAVDKAQAVDHAVLHLRVQLPHCHTLTAQQCLQPQPPLAIGVVPVAASMSEVNDDGADDVDDDNGGDGVGAAAAMQDTC